MPRKKRHEEHANHEAWAIPYGDLITLLLAFFVVMYAVSAINEGKYRVLSDALSAAFRGTPKTPEPLQFYHSQRGSGKDFKMPLIQTIQRPIPIENSWRIPLSVDRDGRAEQAAAEAARLDRIAEEVEQALADMVLAGEVSVRRDMTFIEIEIRTDVLFPSAVARLSEEAIPTIRRLGQILEPFPNPVRVEGHTDSMPITTLQFPSNWELSAARSASVVRLLAEEGVTQERLAVVGFGEYRPVADNGTAVGRQQNRRVTLIVLGEQERADAGIHGFRGWTKNEMLPSAATTPESHVASETTPDSKE